MKIFYSLMVVMFFIYAILYGFAGDIDSMRYGVIVCLLCAVLRKEYE